MSEEEKPQPQPPKPPSVSRKIQLQRLQLIGIPLLLLLPLLALMGVFGESTASAKASNAQLALEVQYPGRFRYKLINPLTLSIHNTSAQPLASLTVNFERAYIDNFSDVSFTPAVKSITDAAYIIEVSDLQPDETRIISVQLQAEKYWQHQGSISVTPDNGPSLTLSLQTFTFP